MITTRLYFKTIWNFENKQIEVKLIGDNSKEYGHVRMKKVNEFKWYLEILSVFTYVEEIDKQLKGLGKQMLCYCVQSIIEMYPELATVVGQYFGKIQLEAGGVLNLPTWRKSEPHEKLVRYYESFGFKRSTAQYEEWTPMEGKIQDVIKACSAKKGGKGKRTVSRRKRRSKKKKSKLRTIK